MIFISLLGLLLLNAVKNVMHFVNLFDLFQQLLRVSIWRIMHLNDKEELCVQLRFIVAKNAICNSIVIFKLIIKSVPRDFSVPYSNPFEQIQAHQSFL